MTHRHILSFHNATDSPLNHPYNSNVIYINYHFERRYVIHLLREKFPFPTHLPQDFYHSWKAGFAYNKKMAILGV